MKEKWIIKVFLTSDKSRKELMDETERLMHELEIKDWHFDVKKAPRLPEADHMGTRSS
ncbi:MAG: hypothetical protein Q8M92_05030 [Candidatus Subteraquimicrobiales bacterium]|nr:hypothetical protein [Candidatus Subteraquimicrobiales bacterium]